ncbi:MAG: type II toxin-antitoxin system prevent-host-death family antitoxin [Nitrospirales bacterium]|nr:type II toxin-antitoxin system prevent-host-death family antitoxin [Nitrospirales bacterium]
MKRLTIREARQALSDLDRILATEGEITITKRGKAVARIVQLERKAAMPSHRNLRERMPCAREGSKKLIREDRDAR